MLHRILSIVAIGLLLSACEQWEVPVNPQLPTLRAEAQPRAGSVATERDVTSTSMTMGLPGGIPMPEDLVPTEGSLNLTVQGAIVMALNYNRSLQVERVNPAISETFIATQQAVFDPTISDTLGYNNSRLVLKAPGGPFLLSRNSSWSESAGISQLLPSGTTWGIDYSFSHNDPETGAVVPYDQRVGLTVSQRLLRGLGSEVNLVSLHQAQIARQSSDYELRGFTSSLVQQVEDAYWDYLFAVRQIKILDDSTSVAQRQLNETLERIKVGQTAETEKFSAEAEVAQRHEAQISGRAQLATARLALQRLISPPGRSLAPRQINLMSIPLLPDNAIDGVDPHLEEALRARPDLNQARLALKNDDLTLVQTKNGLLPELDLFITLGKTGYADSFSGSVSAFTDTRSNDLAAQLQFSYPLGNRAARAAHARATLSRQQQLESISNLRELVEQDVRGAIIQVRSVREQVDATSATRALQQETLRAEQDKLSVGRSTLLLVAQAERDLLTAQINELQASIAYLKSIVALYQLDGSLLERRGVLCPGAEPVALPEETAATAAGAP